MKKYRRALASDQAAKLDLATSGVEQILAADDEIHALQPVIDDDGELIRPVAMPVAGEHIAALFRRSLFLVPKAKIVELLHRRFEPHAHARAGGLAQTFVPAASGIPAGADIGTRALTRVRQAALPQVLERTLVQRAALALPGWRPIGDESQPRKILEERGFELRAAPGAIVIFDA